MPRFLRMPVLALLLTLTLGVAYEVAAETYVIPIWSSGLPASDGQWWAQSLVINPHAFDVTYQIAGVYPMATEPCLSCTVNPAPVVTIEPGGTRMLQPPSFFSGQRVIAGSVEVRSSHTLNIHSVAYRLGPSAVRQRLDVAEGWLGPGVHRFSSVEFALQGVRFNVFVVNPSDTVLEVALWTANRAENEIRASVAPRSMRVIGLPMPVCGGGPCSFPAEFPPSPLWVHIETSGTFMAATSSVSSTWAVFSLPDAAER